jgi:hypothetical protein
LFFPRPLNSRNNISSSCILCFGSDYI